MCLHSSHQEGIDFIERVDDTQEVAWIALGKDGEDVANCWFDQVLQLRLRCQFEKGWMEGDRRRMVGKRWGRRMLGRPWLGYFPDQQDPQLRESV